jgi:hypothetical protein
MQLWYMTWQNVLSHGAERMDAGSDRAIYRDADMFHSSRNAGDKRQAEKEKALAR